MEQFNFKIGKEIVFVRTIFIGFKDKFIAYLTYHKLTAL